MNKFVLKVFVSFCVILVPFFTMGTITTLVAQNVRLALAMTNPAAAASTFPSVTTGPAMNVAETSVTLVGVLDSLGAASTVSVAFEYGPTISYGNTTTAQEMTQTGTFNTNVTGLSPGITYHYRAIASGGSSGSAAGDDNIFTTTRFVPPTVSTTAAADINSTGVALKGYLVLLGSESRVKVYFQYGLDTSYGNTTTALNLTTTGFFTTVISNLAPGTIYHFRAVADSGSRGIVTGEDFTFTTTEGQSPAVNTVSAIDVTQNTATLTGLILHLGTAASAKVFFEYGNTTSYGGTTAPQTINTVGPTGVPFRADISNLNPGTTYHFRAVADGGGNGTGVGVDRTFLTLGTKLRPEIITAPATKVTANSARLNGSITDLGVASTVSVSFEYGLTTSYGNTATAQEMTTTGGFSTDITGLKPGTTYHYRALADAGLNGAAAGTDATFVTLAVKPLLLNTANASDITTNSAILNGLITDLGVASTVSVSFEYGETISYGITTIAQVTTTTGAFSANITGLNPGTTYHYRAMADAGLNGAAAGTDLTFVTLAIKTPSLNTAKATEVTANAATLTGLITDLGAASMVSVSFEYGITTKYGNTTAAQGMTTTGTFSTNITGLSPGTTYHYRAVAEAGLHGSAAGTDAAFVTLAVKTPTLNTAKATEVTANSATLNGAVTALGAASTVNVSFEYGLTASYGNSTTAQAITTSGAFSTNVTGLKPGTTYHYRALGDAGSVGKVVGNDMTFTVLGQTTGIPGTTATTTETRPVVPTQTTAPSPTFEPGQTSTATPIAVPAPSGNLGITISVIAGLGLFIGTVIALVVSRRSKE